MASFPKSVELSGGESVELRVATNEDRSAILQFAAGLDEADLLFLRVDITQPDAVDRWLSNIENGLTVSLIAYAGDQMVGYATVDRNPARWTRRVGEIRVNVGPAYRSKGLGRHLTAQVFEVARNLGLKKLMAHMTPDQLGAQAAFKRLGFVAEALLGDYVEDRNGMPHDLVIMSRDLEGFSEFAGAPLKL